MIRICELSNSGKKVEVIIDHEDTIINYLIYYKHKKILLSTKYKNYGVSNVEFIDMIGNGEKSGLHRYGFGKLLMNTAIQYSNTLIPKPLFCFGYITGMNGIEGNREDNIRDLLNYFSNYGLFAVDDASNGRVRIQADLHNLKLFDGFVLNTFSAIQPLSDFHALAR